MKLFEVLEEGLLDTPSALTLEQRFGQLQQKFDIARKMLGLTNKLANPEERKVHRGRVMRLMNELRREIGRIMLMLDNDQTE